VSHPFNPNRGLIVAAVPIEGPSGSVTARLALDTGATRTVIDDRILQSVSCDPAAFGTPVRIVTGSGTTVAAPREVTRFSALDFERTGFRVLAHRLPPSAGVDGVLGLDFLRGTLLQVDFRSGVISLT